MREAVRDAPRVLFVIRSVEVNVFPVVQLENPRSGPVVVSVHRTPLPNEDTLDSVTQADYTVAVVENVVLLFVSNRSLVVVHVALPLFGTFLFYHSEGNFALRQKNRPSKRLPD